MQLCREALGKGQWEHALDLLQELRVEPWGAYGELLGAVAAGLHEALVMGNGPPLDDARRAELCWRVHELLGERKELDLEEPDWLPVLEQQLVLTGAQLWRERSGKEEPARERALALFERLKNLISPCPGWIWVACEELRGHGAEEQRLGLAVALLKEEGTTLELMELMASCCERCSREALAAGAWGTALERQEEARNWLDELCRQQPENASGRWQNHALLIFELLDQLKGPLLNATTPDRAELLWGVHKTLEAYGRLPLTPPAWLAGVEVQLLQEGALVWKELIRVEMGATERTWALAARLSEKQKPTPPWVGKLLQDLDSSREDHTTLKPQELVALLGASSAQELEQAVAGWLASHGPTDPPRLQPLERLIGAIGALWAEGKELSIEHFNGLGRAWTGWQAGLERQPLSPWPAWDAAGQGLSLALDARELRTLRQRVLGIQEQGPQLERLEEAELVWWTEEALACFTQIGLWGEGSVWTGDVETLWLYLPLLQAISVCSGRMPAIERPPEPDILASLLEDPKVLVLSGVPSRPGGNLKTNLEALLVEVESQHAQKPYHLAVVGPGDHRLPLCMELRLRLSIGCVGLGSNHTIEAPTVFKDTGAGVGAA